METLGLHPRLVQLLRDQGWEGLTQAQDQALVPLLAGKHTLLVAPTGHGKTEASLIPVLSRMMLERDKLRGAGRPWPVGFKVLYVTPLRALNRDLMGRLESWGEALGFGIGVRHGDTSQGERTRQSKSPPDLLITTPETVQLLLYGDTLRKHLATTRFVILDEVHELAVSERGAQLLVALERIEEVVGQPAELRQAKAPERTGPTDSHARPGGGFQRIGVSATVADPAQVARWLGGRDRTVEVVVVKAAKEIRLAVVHPEPAPGDEELATQLAVPPNLVAQMHAIRRLCLAHKRVLVFHNTRDGAELLASRSALLDQEAGKDPLLGLHHGSLSAEVRTEVEEAFKAGRIRALVATSSLELGIDVGAIDHVVQVGSPRSVARLVQRLGRSGHRVGAVSDGTLVATGPEDILECLAVARRAKEGRLEPLVLRLDPLVVLANQLVALTNEYAGLDRGWARTLVKRAGCFLDLDDNLFDATWETLLDVKTVFPEDGGPDGQRWTANVKADPRDDEEDRADEGPILAPFDEPDLSPPSKTVHTYGRSGRARRHFLDHISLIPDEKTYRVIDESSKRSIGTVDDAFVAASMAQGALIVMAGRSWRVLEVETETARVRVAPVKELGPIPQWTGAQLPVSFEVAQEVARLRRHLSEKDEKALAAYPLAPAIRAKASEPIEKQKAQGLEVPTDTRVTLEVNRRVVIVNVALGTRGNEALGRITQSLMHQRLGAPLGMEADAYRIHFTLPQPRPSQELVDTWRAIDPASLDLLLSLVLRDSPLVRYHLVHVAKHFGALPKELDPNRFGRRKLDALFEHIALQEETLSRLIHDRMDVAAVAAFCGQIAKGLLFTIQGQGPLSFLGQDESRRIMANPKTDEAVLSAVKKRIEDSDALLACTTCGNHWQSKVLLLPRKVVCRRCQSIQVACLRPWNEDKLPLLRHKDIKKLTSEERHERERMIRNGAMVAAYGNVAARCMVARGVGPDTAARILQKVQDPESPAFWREILQAELTFARTNMYWKR
ncbi:MAG TPA: DEAD/DEAH box helicase [Candidatus Thermoplasmatota archaeon]|nr:DEAD/DEAH box helicase [Candidatus Thermoplasmatota archaeon]